MEPFTLDRHFNKEVVVDAYDSIIWTERYYGDSDVQLVVPISDSKMKFEGISLLKWMNNRFVRASAAHEDRYWYLSGSTVGVTLWEILYYMCVGTSPYLDGTIDTGIDNPAQLAIPGLYLKDYDESGPAISVGVPYGPVYDAMREIATTYEVGMQIVREDTDHIGFRSYKGLDRTSNQSINSQVRFSPQMDSFTNIKSLAKFKSRVYAFVPGNPDGLATDPGFSDIGGAEYTGFDMRALLVFAEDITTDMVGGSSANLLNILNSRAEDARTNNAFVAAVDGEIVPDNQFQYGVHYNLGDVIEVQGNTGIVQDARITEYIRSQDASGEKAYPTVTMIS
jgi:hypothetical protein